MLFRSIPRKVPKDLGAAPKDSSQNPEDAEEIIDAMEVEEEGIPEQVLLIEALWTRPFIAYLAREELPADRKEARQIIRRSRSFTLINGELYKRSISGIFQRCIALEDGISILRDIHEGICGHHAGSRSLVEKAFRSGLYWLTAAQDAKDLVMKCEACQRFTKKPGHCAKASF